MVLQSINDFHEAIHKFITLFFLWYQLPQRTVDTIAIKQQLLSQYDMLQSRIKDLKGAAEKEVCSRQSCSSVINYFPI